MAILLPGILPPTYQTWKYALWIWQLFPAFTGVQWLTDFYPMGKTSIESRLNIPGKIGWFTMEAPGFLTLLYIMFNLPETLGLNWRELPLWNWAMAGMFVTHYLYRAVLYPLVLQPSMSPIHVLVWSAALTFQLMNATCIGGYLAGYGPKTEADWSGTTLRTQVGTLIWAAGLIGNIYHDDVLRALRRAGTRKQEKQVEEKAAAEGKSKEKVSVDKVYLMPEAGLFKYVLHPHYFCEWIEWIGFWVVGGWACVPARCFVINEVTSMLPRAITGWHWYVGKFGRDKVGDRKAIVPGLI